MDIKNKIEEILLTDYQYVDCYTVDKLLDLFAVSGRSEQFVCLCPRTKEDNCDRKEPCKGCETCQHLRQTNCH